MYVLCVSGNTYQEGGKGPDGARRHGRQAMIGSKPVVVAPSGKGRPTVEWTGTGAGRAGENEQGWPADLREMRGAVPWMVRT